MFKTCLIGLKQWLSCVRIELKHIVVKRVEI